MSHAVASLKRKLRDLKKVEISIRFKGRSVAEGQRLVWDVFFSTKGVQDASVKYPLAQLLQMDREALKAVFEEYFYRIYFQYARDHGLMYANVYDPGLLSLLGLPPYAGMEDIKRRFRELAKKYHPDHGGDSTAFIEVLNTYEQLTDKQR